MCDQALRNWNGEHPNAPACAKRPLWFDSIQEQAQTLLAELQRCEVIGGTPVKGGDAEGYFRIHRRWPDHWYQQRGLPIPPPGPDPDWRLNDPVRALASAAVIAGAVYMGAWKPITKGLKGL